MTEQPIGVDLPQSADSTYQVSPMNDTVQAHNHFQQQIDRQQRAINAMMMQLHSHDPSSSAYRKLLAESNTAKRELAAMKAQDAPLSQQVDAFDSQQQAQQAQAASQAQQLALAQKKTDAQNALQRAQDALVAKQQQVVDERWTKRAADKAVADAQAAVQRAQTGLANVNVLPSLTLKRGATAGGVMSDYAAGPPTNGDTDWSHRLDLQPAAAGGTAPTGAYVPMLQNGKWIRSSVSDMIAKVTSDPKALVAAKQLLIKQGVPADSVRSPAQIQAHYQDLLATAGSYGFSPLEASKWSKANGIDLFGTSGSGSGSGGSVNRTTTTNTNTTHTTQFNTQSIHSTVSDAFQKYLGRDVTAKELAQITDKLNTNLKAHPDVTRGSETSAMQGIDTGTGVAKTINRTGGTTTTSGFDPGQFATAQALKTHGAAGYQAATTFYDELSNTFGSGR